MKFLYRGNTVTTQNRTTAEQNIYPQTRDFFALLKPRVMSLVVFSGLAGMWIAPGRADMPLFLQSVAMLCLAVGAGSAGAINMWFDRDIDAQMTRTKTRPIPAGRVIPAEALGFALVLQLLSVMVMGLALNWIAAGILAFAGFFYAVIYTMWLKRATPQNIVIGGAAGAFPPMIGWAAVTGDISIYPVILFFIIFFWTPPHFWALSLFASGDYERAGVPMLPVVKGARTTKIHMFVYTLVLLPLCLMPYFMGYASVFYAGIASALNLLFILSAVRVLQSDEGDVKPAKQMFGYSIFYLFALFLAIMLV
jgi:protoheme IX farnesyltransferase